MRMTSRTPTLSLHHYLVHSPLHSSGTAHWGRGHTSKDSTSGRPLQSFTWYFFEKFNSPIFECSLLRKQIFPLRSCVIQSSLLYHGCKMSQARSHDTLKETGSFNWLVRWFETLRPNLGKYGLKRFSLSLLTGYLKMSIKTHIRHKRMSTRLCIPHFHLLLLSFSISVPFLLKFKKITYLFLSSRTSSRCPASLDSRRFFPQVRD